MSLHIVAAVMNPQDDDSNPVWDQDFFFTTFMSPNRAPGGTISLELWDDNTFKVGYPPQGPRNHAVLLAIAHFHYTASNALVICISSINSKQNASHHQ